MKYILTLAVALFASSLFAQEITIPETKSGKVGRFVYIEAKTTAANVVWMCDHSDNVDLAPMNDRGTRVIFNTDTEGVYNIVAFIAVIDTKTKLPVVAKSNTCVITIGSPKPPEPLPPPVVLDDFQKKVYQEFNVLGKPKQRVLDLATFYEDSQKVITDPTIKSSYDLELQLQKKATAAMGTDVMSIRILASQYMKDKMPGKAGPLDDELRLQWLNMFRYLTESMRKVAK